MEGDELHPSATMRLNVVLEEELRSCLLMVPKLGETVADRIIKERICRGQFLSWKNLQDRIKGIGDGKVTQLQKMGYDIRPTVTGLLLDLVHLTPEALKARGLTEESVGKISAMRDTRGEKPLVSVDMARRMLKATAWREVVEKLLGSAPSERPLDLSERPYDPPALSTARYCVGSEAADAGGELSAGPLAGSEGNSEVRVKQGAPSGASGDIDIASRPAEGKLLVRDNNNNGKAEAVALVKLMKVKQEEEGEEGDRIKAVWPVEVNIEAAVKLEVIEPPDIKPGGWWWKGLDEKTPFPPEFRDPKSKGKIWSYLYSHIWQDPEKPGQYIYNDEQLNHEQVQELRLKWEQAYISVPDANRDGNLRETAAFRKSATCTEKARWDCWVALKDIEETRRIPAKHRDKWRADPWGNVVSIHASPASVCGFHVDHIFPWSKGGLSITENFAAVQGFANMHIKRDKILNGNDGNTLVDRMACGLSVDQLLGFLHQADEYRALKPGGRTKAQLFMSDMENLLCDPYPLPLSQLRKEEPGWQTFRFLRQAHLQGQLDLYGDELKCPQGGDDEEDDKSS